MYIHIGSHRTVKSASVVGFFDLDGEVTPKITADFLRRAEDAGIVESAGEDIPRSFVLCQDKEGERVILSHISAKTLRDRGEAVKTK